MFECSVWFTLSELLAGFSTCSKALFSGLVLYLVKLAEAVFVDVVWLVPPVPLKIVVELAVLVAEAVDNVDFVVGPKKFRTSYESAEMS